MLVNVPQLVTAYYTTRLIPWSRRSGLCSGPPGIAVRRSRDLLTNGTSLPSVRPFACTENSKKSMGLCSSHGYHALSVPALASALEVLAANDVEVMLAQGTSIHRHRHFHAILTHNRGRKTGLADGIVITPSHNPPHDGGFKYNPPNGVRRMRSSPTGSKPRQMSFSGQAKGVKRISHRKPERLHNTPL